jgi:hypothetical protein
MVSHNSGDRIVEIASGLIEADWEVVYRTNGDQFWMSCWPLKQATVPHANRKPRNSPVALKIAW